MRIRFVKHAIPLAAGLALALGAMAPMAPLAQAAKKGGILKYVVPAEPPSFDGHRETTFALIHPIAPFYSVLIRVNPDNPSSPTDFVCDLCTEMPKPSADNSYVFKLRKGVKFSDGSSLTAHDVVATFKKIIFPAAGVASARKAFYVMVDSVTATDDHTVKFKLKYPSGAFIPALANPYNFIYAKKILDKDMHWYEKNVMGSGPFRLKERQAGALISGTRNPDYYHSGKPYLDGFEAIFAKKQSLRVQAVRGDRAAIEFRGFPPKSRDDLAKALGKDITVQESNWNCVLIATPNHKKKPFDNPNVRRALSLAIDRWGGSKYLSRIAIVKAVGGVAFPGHPLAATKSELEQIAGYWPDINKSRAEAKRLLKEAGASNLKFTLNNRGVDQPYKIVGTWLIDQWKQVGLTVDQRVQPTGPFYASLRKKKDFDVSIDFNCQAVVNPLLDVAKYISDDVSGNNYGNYQDREMDKMFNAMNQAASVSEQRSIMRKFEKRALDEQANAFITLWWYRIIPHRSYVKGWKISPSHYLNQDLSGVWLEQ
ncbi:MAG TPA: ABC transporter substrate-binding protein [Alphaproteobacteria bacterium]|jgi:peptide/nickel transport system substrate-binding protein|nr:ABC transporter substrate-binding protein [Alphaproteobacteria bacterium]MDP7164071.1 ABC transporter substrate-binding protein [Alphaproteobacteria bacterium]MDP7427502.1 ABC transporter substrate-binding protein [Alphaproteobacteria bacterium]HJM49163.1 ABC transporter substrate-binding protein [Alphaproteobacteria bacterium]|tara:strand:- start:156 stop:1772 length:1617 start_codon:yes stop_codon:yes gene_type:complete